MSDWEGASDGGKPSTTPVAVPVKKTKWEGEDEEEKIASDWEESSDSNEEKKASAAGLPPSKKKGTLKQNLVEKEAERKRRLGTGEFDEEYLDLREKFMDEKDRRRLMREKELEADMNNASDLFGAATIQPTSSGAAKGGSKPVAAAAPKLPPNLAPFLALPAKLTTKADFDALSRLIYTNLIQPHATSGQYAAFVETHTKALCSTLKEGETRKVANVVTGLVTEKVAAARAAAKKKTGATAVVSGKGIFAGEGGGKGKYDMTVYDEALDDYGGDSDDFM